MIRFGLAVILGCLGSAPPSSVQAQREPVPPEIVERVERALEEHAGAEWFRAHCTYLPGDSWAEPGRPDCEGCAEFLRHRHHLLQWRLTLAGPPAIEHNVLVQTDAEGRLVGQPEGLPACATHPELCRPTILEFEAVRIAREAGLEDGIEPWQVRLFWLSTGGRYAWGVTATRQHDEEGTAQGSFLSIDAVDGAVLGRGEWFSMP